MVNMSNLESRKGEPLRFKSGKCAGHMGWKDKDGPCLPVQMHCILQCKDGSLKRVRVKQTGVAARRGEPKTCLQAAIHQHPDLDVAIDKVASLLAKCNINSSPELLDLFDKRVADGHVRQHQLGSKALWKHVKCPDGQGSMAV